MNSNNIANSVSAVSLNEIDNASGDAAQIAYLSKLESLSLYIPRKISLEELLENNPPDFSYHKDYFAYILHLISALPSRNWELIDRKGFTLIGKSWLQKRIHGYKKYVDYLVSNGILEENRHYVVGVKPGGLKIANAYASELNEILITKRTLIKSIVHSNNKKFNLEKTEEMSFLKKWFNEKIEVDLEGATELLKTLAEKEDAESEGEDISVQRLNMRLLPLLELKLKQNLQFNIDNTGLRLHTPLTRTMKELRKFISYEGKTLCSIDIVNSQPYFCRLLFDETLFKKNNIKDKISNPLLTSHTLFPIMLVEKIISIKNKEDVKKFLNMVSGGVFYEIFGQVLKDANLISGDIPNSEIRDKVKDITFSAIYSANTSIGHNPAIKIFAQLFPHVYEMFKIIKKGHGNSRHLPILLQKLEAELILEKICKSINKAYPGIPLFTVHDSIVTTEENVEVVKNFMLKILRKNIGIAPKLKVERWE